MGKIMLADHLINPDDITLISERTPTFQTEPLPPKVKGLKGLLAPLEYRTEKYTCIVVKVSEGTRYMPPIEHKDFEIRPDPIPVGEYEVYSYYTVFNDKNLLKRAKEYFDSIRLDLAFTEDVTKKINTLREIGMEMTFGRWTNRNYLNTNMHYDPSIKTKQDFIQKYLNASPAETAIPGSEPPKSNDYAAFDSSKVSKNFVWKCKRCGKVYDKSPTLPDNLKTMSKCTNGSKHQWETKYL